MCLGVDVSMLISHGQREAASIFPGRTLICSGWVNAETGSVIPEDLQGTLLLRTESPEVLAQENPGSGQLRVDFAEVLAKAWEDVIVKKSILNCKIEMTLELFLLFGVSNIKPIF